MNIRLHIERLVLDGVALAPHERPHLQAAVEAELARLLAEGGVAGDLRQGGALASVRAGEFQLAQENHPDHLGRQIAQAVYGGISS